MRVTFDGEPVRPIPLRARDGSLRAMAVVDEADYEYLMQWNWCLSRGYAIRANDPKSQGMHRLVLGLVPGDGLHTDHINFDRLDNRRKNLRPITHGGNGQNRPRKKPGHTSDFRGVLRLPSGRWRAVARVDGRQKHFGCFDTELEAALAAEAARKKHQPFANPDPALVEALEALSHDEATA